LAAAKLADQPMMGRAVAEADSDHIRELVFRKNYRIIYVLRDDCVQILAIIHAARDLESAPSKPWDVI
jgi:plasmid stabilization system protein ParE